MTTNANSQRKISYMYNVSLDGFIEDSDGELDWGISNEDTYTFINALQSTVDLNIYGRRTYALMAAYWSTADQDTSLPPYRLEFARNWQRTPKVVFSKTLEAVAPNVRLVRGSIAGEVARLRAQPGQDISVAGATLAAQFMELDLIDEFQLFVNPVVLGGGKPMFPPLANRIHLRLIESRSFTSGLVFLRYQRASAEA